MRQKWVGGGDERVRRAGREKGEGREKEPEEERRAVQGAVIEVSCKLYC